LERLLVEISKCCGNRPFRNRRYPYVIDANNQDNYPLMAPFDIEGDAVVLPPPEPFPTILVAAAAVMVAVVIVGVLVYFRKRNH
jgi:hypothetical protein